MDMNGSGPLTKNSLLWEQWNFQHGPVENDPQLNVENDMDAREPQIFYMSNYHSVLVLAEY